MKWQVTIKINRKAINEKDSIKYIGVLIDSTLKLEKSHFKHIVAWGSAFKTELENTLREEIICERIFCGIYFCDLHLQKLSISLYFFHK